MTSPLARRPAHTQVIPVQARSDNWMYIVIDEASKQGAVVDPFDAPKLTEAVKENGVKVCCAPGSLPAGLDGWVLRNVANNSSPR